MQIDWLNFKELGANLSNYPNVIAWYERCKDLPGSAENIEGAKMFADKVNGILKDRLWMGVPKWQFNVRL